MDGPNFAIERQDQGLDGLGRKPLEPLSKVFMPFAETGGGALLLLRRRLVVEVSAAARRGVTSNSAFLQDPTEIPMF
ncbi:MAG: hypothetical protein DLM68_15180 [Hyphomicrobiales bacterium]|nr:MAG: hypothetical protein DLM68_15180 [Hyphomicrobiales bacterium]